MDRILTPAGTVTLPLETITTRAIIRVTEGDRWVTVLTAIGHPSKHSMTSTNDHRVTEGDRYFNMTQLFDGTKGTDLTRAGRHEPKRRHPQSPNGSERP